jgi:hypothetical protein
MVGILLGRGCGFLDFLSRFVVFGDFCENRLLEASAERSERVRFSALFFSLREWGGGILVSANVLI